MQILSVYWILCCHPLVEYNIVSFFYRYNGLTIGSMVRMQITGYINRIITTSGMSIAVTWLNDFNIVASDLVPPIPHPLHYNDERHSHLCGRYYGQPLPNTTVICQRQTIGRYVYLHRTGTTTLSVCEFEVYGTSKWFIRVRRSRTLSTIDYIHLHQYFHSFVILHRMLCSVDEIPYLYYLGTKTVIDKKSLAWSHSISVHHLNNQVFCMILFCNSD